MTSPQDVIKIAFESETKLELSFMENVHMQEYEELKKMVEEIEADVNKAAGGNKAAGTRVRKQMQTIKQACQNVRNRILEIRTTD